MLGGSNADVRMRVTTIGIFRVELGGIALHVSIFSASGNKTRRNEKEVSSSGVEVEVVR